MPTRQEDEQTVTRTLRATIKGYKVVLNIANNKHLRKYLESHTEKEKDSVVCLVADDTDIAKSGRTVFCRATATKKPLFPGHQPHHP